MCKRDNNYLQCKRVLHIPNRKPSCVAVARAEEFFPVSLAQLGTLEASHQGTRRLKFLSLGIEAPVRVCIMEGFWQFLDLQHQARHNQVSCT